MATVSLEGADGQVKVLKCARAGSDFKPIPGTEFELKADLVLLAMGFTGPAQGSLTEQPGLKLDRRGNILANDEDYETSLPGVFVAGDARRGQSLIVWAIAEGRKAAAAVNLYLAK